MDDKNFLSYLLSFRDIRLESNQKLEKIKLVFLSVAHKIELSNRDTVS